MKQTPDHERPARAVPQPADEHAQHHIDLGARPAVAVAAQRDVDVVADKARQRHMPTGPEVLHIERQVGLAKVDWQGVAQQQGQTGHNEGVAAEIQKNLQAVTQHGRRHRPAGKLLGPLEDRVHHVLGQPRSQHHFLKQPQTDPVQRAADLARLTGLVRVFLCKKRLCPQDRTSKQGGPEAQEQHHIAP